MWLRCAASTRMRVGRVSLTRHSHHERPVVNSVSRRAVSLRFASSTSFRPQPEFDPGKRVVDLEPARRVLRETFGHETFRPGQEEVISRLLSGESVVLSWPKRSGSSICYLVPAVLESCETKDQGITVVISRSIPFLTHAADVLRRLGIPAGVLGPSREPGILTEPSDKILSQIRRGQIRILYLFSRFCNGSNVIHAVKSAPGGLHRLVVADAEYSSPQLRLVASSSGEIASAFAKITKPRSLILLTGTCHPDILRDTRQAFSLPESSSHSLSPLPPLNLQLHAYPSPSIRKSFAFLSGLLSERTGQTVLFTAKGKMARDVAAMLQRAGLNTKAIGSIKAHGVKEILSDFEASKFQILCTYPVAARIMNQPRVRNVVFSVMPTSVMALDRQLRVAGEDGEYSEAFFVFNARAMRDEITRKCFKMPCRQDINHLLKAIFNGESTDSTAYFNLRDLTLELDLAASEIENLLFALEEHLGLIKLGNFVFTACRFKFTRGEQSYLAKSTSVVDNAIAAHSIKSGQWYDLRWRGTGMQATGLGLSQVVGRLKELADCGHIKLFMREGMSTARILQHPSPKCRKNNIESTGEMLYQFFQRKLEAWSQSRREVVELFTKDRCTSVGLAEYFGTELPGGQNRCGRCDWCLTGQPLVLHSELNEEEVDPGKVKAVLEAIPDRDHPRFLARVAAGHHSSRVNHLKLHKSPVFRSMQHVKFDALVRVFTKECGVPDDEIDDWL